MAEVAGLAEELAVVGGHDDVGVLRDEVVELLEHAVEVADGVDLALLELVELVLVEELEVLLELVVVGGLRLVGDLIVHLLEDAVHTADARPHGRVLVRLRVGTLLLLLRDLHFHSVFQILHEQYHPLIFHQIY